MYINVINQELFHNKVMEVRSTYTDKYKTPTTADEYWNTVSTHLSMILNIIDLYHPEKVITDDDTYIGKSTSVAVVSMLEDKNPGIIHIFNKTWSSAPDEGGIHIIPGWDIFCDLCSESYLIYEQQ